jgi:flagellar protein FlaG
MNILGQIDVSTANKPTGYISKPVQAPQAPTIANETPKASGKVASEQDTLAAAKTVADALKSQNLNMQFSKDSDTGKTVFQIVDSETKKVIRQVPSEEIIEISKSIDKMQGFLLNQKA